MRAFSYNPLYLAQPSCLNSPGKGACRNIINDDVSAEWAMNMWSETGRGDIKTMATFGANAVRLYGNDPRFSKRKFFDELLKNGMKVVTGLSNYPFSNQNAPAGCIWANKYDCFQSANDSYYSVLTKGEFVKDGYYHNAVEVVSIMNEPDINAWNPGAWTSQNNYIKAMVSGFDGILSAEEKAQVKPWKNGKLPKITVSWSYGMLAKELCNEKGYIMHMDDPNVDCGPSIAFMAQLYFAIQDPVGTVGYQPKHDLKKFYKERWILALQPFNRADEVYRQAVVPGQTWEPLKGYKMYFGEFDPAVNACSDHPTCKAYGKNELERDLKSILNDPKWTKTVMGVSFFMFQQAYNKDSYHEIQYGMFELQPQSPWKTGYIEGDSVESHPINCLAWKTKDLAEAVAAAFGGSVPELTCPSPHPSVEVVV